MRTAAGTLGTLLFGHTRGAILRVLYGHPDRMFFVRQIAREIGVSVGSVQRELATLSKLGLIDRSISGKQVYYQVNRNHPVFLEMKALVAKTVGAFELLRLALAPLANRIKAAFVYGSMARQEEKAESDVDLTIVGDVTLEEVLAQLAPVEQIIGRPVNPTLYSLAEFQSGLAAGNHFLKSMMRGEKVYLIGEQDGLGQTT